MDSQWYKDALIYEVDIRSFHDSDHDGIGDFRGLADKLDYLQDLGVTALVVGSSYCRPQRGDGRGLGEDHSVYPGCGTARISSDSWARHTLVACVS
jgi:maltose alpha-D-glucosyltransferase/alpha-amylase